MTKLTGLGLLAASLLCLAGCGGKPLAEVNGKKITLKDYEQQLQIYQGMRQGPAADLATRRAILEQMVKQELLMQEAGKAGLDKKAEILARIQEQAQEYKSQLKSRIANEQAQLDQVDKAVRTRLLIEELLAVRGKDYGITEQQVKSYYDNLKKKGQADNLPPFKQVWERVRQQMILDRVTDEAKEKNDVQIYMERLPAAVSEDPGLVSAIPQGPAAAGPSKRR
jgi:peptidyl-prolyl cis-trans isomerase C